MKYQYLIKLIVRNWWRNKLFFLVSIVSLSIGLACTNLLLTYFVHDSNIENNNPYKDRVFCLRQDDPMGGGGKVAYVTKEIPQNIKEKITGVEDFMRIQHMAIQTVEYKHQTVKEVVGLSVDSTLNTFFPPIVISGNITRMLVEPNKVALSKHLSDRLFGGEAPLGKQIEIVTESAKRTFEVTAIFKEQSQSLLKYDILTALPSDYWGGTAFLKLANGVNPQQVANTINTDASIPTMVPGLKYYIDPLENLYFIDTKGTPQQSLPFIHQTQSRLLYIGLFAAFLILMIACCNYTNMSLSRLIQQLKMVYIEKLMGGHMKDIRMQLFGDVVLTVGISFILSIVLINWALPSFNSTLDARLEMTFFFSGQMLPLLLGFLLLIAFVPAWYMSYKLVHLSYTDYKIAYSGRNKQRFVAILVVVQFAISCGLILSMLMAYKQQNLVIEKASIYDGCIEIGDSFGGPTEPLKNELAKQVPGIESMSVSTEMMLNSSIRELLVKQADGSEVRSFSMILNGDCQYLRTLGIEQIEGKLPEQLQEEMAHPVLVNETYVRMLVPEGINPIGHSLKEFDEFADSLYVIGGIVHDFPINSIEKDINPAEIKLLSFEKQQKANILVIRLKKENRTETIAQIEKIWRKMNNDGVFRYTDMHRLFMERNSKVVKFTQILTFYTIIGLLLTLFGLFGISWYATRQRVREISIRKLHGASRWQILWLLNKPFSTYSVIAYLVALPLTYYWLTDWFTQFAYHVSFGVIDFILPFVVIWVVAVVSIGIQAYFLFKIDSIESMKVE